MSAKFRVEITRSAERDIDEIWTYISTDNPTQALEFITQLERQVATLERFPQRCPMIPENEILGTQFRHLIYGHYRTLFCVSGKVVYVLRIIHSARLLDSSMFETQA
jgi:plasmid stabilization system protein ParE